MHLPGAPRSSRHLGEGTLGGSDGGGVFVKLPGRDAPKT